MKPEILGDGRERSSRHAPPGGRRAPPPAPEPARTVENRLLGARVEKALQKVSSRERTVFLLRHYNDLMLDEIAETMQISVGSVKSYLFRCLRKLQKELAVPGTAGAGGGPDEGLEEGRRTSP